MKISNASSLSADRQASDLFNKNYLRMKPLRFLLLGFFISVTITIFGQDIPKKTAVIQDKNLQVKPVPKDNIKSVPKATLQQLQLKKINQNKAKLQSQQLKKAVRRSNIVRKLGRK